MKKHNFSAGPAILAPQVIQQAAAGVADLDGIGLSILELSHRGKEVVAVFDETTQAVKDILGVPEGYEVLFMSGGASSQFFIAAMNLMNDGDRAAYVDAGTWSSKAIEAAKQFGQIDVLASSKEKTYSYIPRDYTVPQDAKYFHFTSNNTIYGTQYHFLPEAGVVPMVCDMSSDFMSKPVDVSKFGIIYAGAQKNLGPAGVTIVIVKKDILGKVSRAIPAMLDYRVFAKEKSMYNTPPVFAVYVCMLTLRWIKESGGLTAIAAQNERKAAILYDEIDRNPLFVGNVAREDRSLMNVCFVMKDRALEPAFAQLAKENGISGIEGHRSVGGFRASIYNAMPIESIQLLASLMAGMEKTHI